MNIDHQFYILWLYYLYRYSRIATLCCKMSQKCDIRSLCIWPNTLVPSFRCVASTSVRFNCHRGRPTLPFICPTFLLSSCSTLCPHTHCQLPGFSSPSSSLESAISFSHFVTKNSPVNAQFSTCCGAAIQSSPPPALDTSLAAIPENRPDFYFHHLIHHNLQSFHLFITFWRDCTSPRPTSFKCSTKCPPLLYLTDR